MNRTYQDYEESADKLKFLLDSVTEYKNSAEYAKAVDAGHYFDGENTGIMNLKALDVTLKSDNFNQNISLPFAKIPSSIFSRLIIQLVNFQLSDGIIINEQPIKDFLGEDSTRQIIDLATDALIGGVAYGAFYNDAIQATFNATEMFVLRDEWDSSIHLAVKFWSGQSLKGTFQFFQVFESDGFTVYKVIDSEIIEYRPKTSYTKVVRTDGTGTQELGTETNSYFPIFPMYANKQHRSELTTAIKSKVDNMDEVISRNATFVNKTDKIFWVMSSTNSGDARLIAETIKTLEVLGLALMGDDEQATPTTIDPNVAPRLQTKDSLESDIYKDFMALNMDELTKSALTATAIKASSAMLKLRGNDLYFHVSDFIKKCCTTKGITVDSIVMTQTILTNELELVQMISLVRGDLTTQKVLELLTFLRPEEVPQLLIDLDVEQMTGFEEVPVIEEVVI